MLECARAYDRCLCVENVCFEQCFKRYLNLKPNTTPLTQICQLHDYRRHHFVFTLSINVDDMSMRTYQGELTKKDFYTRTRTHTQIASFTEEALVSSLNVNPWLEIHHLAGTVSALWRVYCWSAASCVLGRGIAGRIYTNRYWPQFITPHWSLGDVPGFPRLY